MYFKTKPIQVGIVCIALKITEIQIKDENGKPKLRNMKYINRYINILCSRSWICNMAA